MWKYTIKVDGMMCGMCESHANDTMRQNFNVKKVSSSHTKQQTVLITEDDISREAMEEAFAPTGYRVFGMEREPYEEKKGWRKLFSK